MYNNIIQTLTDYNNLLSNNNFEKSKFMHVNTFIKDDTYVSKFNVAGFDKSEIKIEFTKRISGYNRQIKVIAENSEFGLLKMCADVPSTIDEKSVKAVLKNVILTISCWEEKIKSPLTNLTIQVE